MRSSSRCPIVRQVPERLEEAQVHATIARRSPAVTRKPECNSRPKAQSTRGSESEGKKWEKESQKRVVP
jgi:hypothetical protein